jgi:hypothetical protein
LRTNKEVALARVEEEAARLHREVDARRAQVRVDIERAYDDKVTATGHALDTASAVVAELLTAEASAVDALKLSPGTAPVMLVHVARTVEASLAVAQVTPTLDVEGVLAFEPVSQEVRELGRVVTSSDTGAGTSTPGASRASVGMGVGAPRADVWEGVRVGPLSPTAPPVSATTTPPVMTPPPGAPCVKLPHASSDAQRALIGASQDQRLKQIATREVAVPQ